MPLPQAIAAASGSLVGRPGPAGPRARPVRRIDVPLQKRLHGEKLKMSHEELKQEHKESEGNAEVKAKMRAEDARDGASAE